MEESVDPRAILVVAAGFALLESACLGGGGRSATTSANSSTVSPAPDGKTFPLLKIVDGTLDYLDPALAYLNFRGRRTRMCISASSSRLT